MTTAVLPESSDKVVDATGAGNAFLEAYTIGLLKAGDHRIAGLLRGCWALFCLGADRCPKEEPRCV